MNDRNLNQGCHLAFLRATSAKLGLFETVCYRNKMVLPFFAFGLLFFDLATMIWMLLYVKAGFVVVVVTDLWKIIASCPLNGRWTTTYLAVFPKITTFNCWARFGLELSGLKYMTVTYFYLSSRQKDSNLLILHNLSVFLLWYYMTYF